ncbi:BQ5605_C016g08097 [Microbotryum silenes-dioicae]|uniref:BQ5605_C016g08097 protein n=1 Tax=Microbotryum silenes-dioicae TaxID=796604 RepID=A0A2X0MH16_9BASI|nr:BQ5605_C016g08097 [Microbotryum silenes-dioicae]
MECFAQNEQRRQEYSPLRYLAIYRAKWYEWQVEEAQTPRRRGGEGLRKGAVHGPSFPHLLNGPSSLEVVRGQPLVSPSRPLSPMHTDLKHLILLPKAVSSYRSKPSTRETIF